MEPNCTAQIQVEKEILYNILAILKYSLDVAILVINGAVLLLLVIHKVGYKQRTSLPSSGYFVVNLLVSDTLVGLVKLIRLPYRLWTPNCQKLAQYKYGCSFVIATGFFAICGSHNALLTVIIDRYIAITQTLRYRQLMTTTRCWRMIAASWLIPAIGWIYLIIGSEWQENMSCCNEHNMMYRFAFFWIPLFAGTMISIVVMQFCAYLKIRQYDSSLFISSVMVVRQSSNKSASLMLQSATVFCLCYVPYAVVLTLHVYFSNLCTKVCFDLASVVTGTTFLINACLYSLKTESIRKRLEKVLTEWRNVFARRSLRKDKANNNNNNGDSGGSHIVSVSVIGLY